MTRTNFWFRRSSQHIMRRALPVCLLLLCALTLHAEEAAPALPVTHITRTTGAITIDGDLNDPGWQNATKFETWYETNPGDNIEPKQKTIGYVTYDDRFFYVAIDSFDTTPSNIRSAFAD